MKFMSISMLLLLVAFAGQGQPGKNNAFLFDEGWRFFKGGARGAEEPAFDDAHWRTVDLPHDWSIEDLPGTTSPFNADAISQVNGGFTTGGTGWYRKEFTIPVADKGKRIQIQFDGVYMNADVWINGSHLGNQPYGYTSFEYDITDKIKYDGKNTLAVEVKNEGVNSRWYSGSGIYRHVWLKKLNPVYIDRLGTYIITPSVSGTTATVNIQTRINNILHDSVALRILMRIVNTQGTEVAKAVSTVNFLADSYIEINKDLVIQKPTLWSVESPSLYKAVLEVYNDKTVLNQEEIIFGIRTISVDAVNGFRLNGKSMKLKGACIHHDHGPLGAASYDRAEERKVQLLKAAGFNAIRSAHNQPSTALLDVCDREGILVIDESFDMWQDAKNSYDYHLYFDQWWKSDLDNMIVRDRNHPSVIMWSIGNELPERWSAKGVKTERMLADEVRRLDTTRPITSAVPKDNPTYPTDGTDEFFAVQDVAGYNYGVINYVTDHTRKPDRVMLCTESYALEAFDYWMGVVDHPWVIGDFIWAGFDYIGEASIGWLGHPHTKNFFPWNLAYTSDLDICGWKRPQSFYRDALLKEKQLSIFVKPPVPTFANNDAKPSWSKWYWHDAVADWNWKGYENKPMDVTVYSSCPIVELFLNGKSLGKKITGRASRFMATWQVPYQQGIVNAVGYDNAKKKINSASLITVEEPARLKLSADRSTINADNQDLSYITVEVVDAKGNRHPKADPLITFEIEGEGVIAGVGNANPMSTESNQLHQRKAWQGRCLVIIKSKKQPGMITLKVSAEGMQTEQVIIHSK